MNQRDADTPRLIAGAAALETVLADLRSRRAVFHSEADLQHEFARVLWQLQPELTVRLEVRQPGPRREALDLQARGPHEQTNIEFKYFTRGWKGRDPRTGETFELRSHAATDLARLHFVSDIARLERFRDQGGPGGLALLLTNERALWLPPRDSRPTRDLAFRIHDGRVLTGDLLWAEGKYEKNTRRLRGRYECTWHDFSTVEGPSGSFRYLAIWVD